MNDKDLDLLRSNIDKRVRIICHDGEVIIAKVHFVFDEYEDVVFDLVWTNRESKYEKHDEQPAYAIDFKDIKSVEALTEEGPATSSNKGPGGMVR